ncbi:transglutaminase family protein [Brachymonas sp. G13]|uniref:transglutaminase family protein n=1 Tax=Brachymonas wangyanguii TaxID=3130163 RepID=UPI0016A687B9|nr:transglutaminase family protein [Ramlibacter sp.]
MKLHVTHETHYRYGDMVDNALHQVFLRPADTPAQQCLQHQLLIAPDPGDIETQQDIFGNTTSWFALTAPHDVLSVTSQAVVETQPSRAARSQLPWEQVRERFVYRSGGPYDPAHIFVFASQYAAADALAAEYARPSFAAGRSLHDAAIELMQRIYQDFIYRSGSTGTGTTASEVLQQRAGVCQDFAHVLLSCLRAQGLAARYVSGYLLTQPPPGQPRLRGADASHAWASVWLPDLQPADADPDHPPGGWLDLDPTNNRWGWDTPGEDYVRVALGRDFSDVSPLRGVINGSRGGALEVAVTVEPEHERNRSEA